MAVSNFAFDPTRAVPARAYRDSAWFDVERERIWRGDWVFATSEDAVANAGDMLPVEIGEQPVLLVRDQSGNLRAISNLCAHRGTLLVEEATNDSRIQCPYHAWTYDDTGQLLAMPFANSEGIDKTAHCLPSYRVEVWHGMVFISLSDDVEPLATRFEAMESLVVERGIDQFQHRADYQRVEEWECNWKVAIMNAMESYHLFKVHPQTLEPYTPTKSSYYIGGSAYATATGGSYRNEDDYMLISLPPGFTGVFTRDSFVWLAVFPAGLRKCKVVTGGAYGMTQDGGALGKLSEWFDRTVSGGQDGGFLLEDKAICERVQRGFVGDFAPGQLVAMERVVVDFGHYLNWRINGVQPPPIHWERQS